MTPKTTSEALLQRVLDWLKYEKQAFPTLLERDIEAALSSPPQPATAGAEPSLRDRLQKRCVDWNAYWRASDSHGVELTKPQAIELLCNALGVEVEIKDNGCVVCDGTGLIGDQRCPDCAGSAKPAGEPRLTKRQRMQIAGECFDDEDMEYTGAIDRFAEAIERAALAAAPAPAEPAAPVPDGWKLVPVEPTKAMRRAGGEFWAKTSGHWSQVAGGAYRAMLAAAPVLKSEGAK